MGYMGFGMRKEDYTRKPKKAFKKYKEHFETNRALQDDVENYWNTNEKISRYKQLKETLGFRIFIALILVVAFGYIIWIFLIREPLFLSQQKEFEENGINQYFVSNEKEVMLINKFAQSLTKRMVSLNYVNWCDCFEITLKHYQVEKFNDEVNWVDPFFLSLEKLKDYKILDDASLIAENQRFANRWMFTFRFSPNGIDSIQPLRYLNIKPKEFRQILNAFKKNSAKLDLSRGTSIELLNKKFGPYRFLIANSLGPKIDSTSVIRTGTIRPGLKWIKIEESWRDWRPWNDNYSY
ncbi:MAG: hypothetical protein KA713_04730 [Chryseotalea sp. WA131a]|jgi:hypothetical protein|nr:MAG: hypothetical protein KA713_04730 [Chryseotalea sp. WA131a]